MGNCAIRRTVTHVGTHNLARARSNLVRLIVHGSPLLRKSSACEVSQSTVLRGRLAISVSPLHANSSALRNAGRSVTAPDSRSVKIFLYPTSANAFRCKARFWRESGFPNRSVASLGVGEYVKGGVHLFKKYNPRTSDPFLVHPCIRQHTPYKSQRI